MAIELAEFIRQLRDKLDTARLAGEGKELKFEVGPIEVELEVEVLKEAGAHAGVRIHVVEGGVGGKLESMSTQRLKLTLMPSVPGSPALHSMPAAAAAKVEVDLTTGADNISKILAGCLKDDVHVFASGLTKDPHGHTLLLLEPMPKTRSPVSVMPPLGAGRGIYYYEVPYSRPPG